MYNAAIVKESSIPTSLSAARFDPNSFRHLRFLLETIGLAHYAGKIHLNLMLLLIHFWLHLLLTYFRFISVQRSGYDHVFYADRSRLYLHRCELFWSKKNYAQRHSR